FSAFSMTEPETPGSDPTQLRSRAIRDRDGYVLNGHKWFTTNGLIADFLIVMAITDPDAPTYERASMLLVPSDTPGVERVRNIPHMAGEHEPFGIGHAEIRYDNVRVPREALIGERGAGFSIAQVRLGPGRIHHCMRWLGQGRRAFDVMCERAKQRQAFGSALADKQTVQNWIADSAAEMQAARLMTLQAAWRIDTEGARAARLDIGLIKFFGARVLHDVIDRAIQVCGALGYSGDLPLEEMYRHARAARLYDGPDEVHRQTVARQILRRYQPPEGIWPTEHLPTRRQAAREKFAALLDAAASDL
ncbi:MAG: acyl-CoA dehydrogenase family protein, partial [Candidatus Dormibacteraceae bacterium]